MFRIVKIGILVQDFIIIWVPGRGERLFYFPVPEKILKNIGYYILCPLITVK